MQETRPSVLKTGDLGPLPEVVIVVVTSEVRLKQLQSRMRTKRLGHFEVLLRTTKLAGTPLSAEILGFREH